MPFKGTYNLLWENAERAESSASAGAERTVVGVLYSGCHTRFCIRTCTGLSGALSGQLRMTDEWLIAMTTVR